MVSKNLLRFVFLALLGSPFYVRSGQAKEAAKPDLFRQPASLASAQKSLGNLMGLEWKHNEKQGESNKLEAWDGHLVDAKELFGNRSSSNRLYWLPALGHF